MADSSYESVRLRYKPVAIAVLLIAESPPPSPEMQSSRQFYYTDRIRKDDRLFINTVKALYPETTNTSEVELEEAKESWLNRFKNDGFYMIEALEESQVHEVSKSRRKQRIRSAVPKLIERVRRLTEASTKIILIKSNVFEEAAEPLRDAGFTVLNRELLDYPGHFNQKAYREKLAQYIKEARE